ncbi:carboxylic ester hydrolase [Actinoplanes philippinensis]|uniref:Carboxylic ester hydrolase n=1 Tax=Actinoplanes philippinensis TaxID=35752 RepID=A0A1I2NAK3_9ACTN|nr:carboxylesterase family protein [Actinoplanes philippinensis]GIE76313.1 carboxylic ester hydrolase [Actinoplanes philippinensis]SFF98391.1 para-nitrobenzyl esterase [Actinoplanes philippinensis]
MAPTEPVVTTTSGPIRGISAAHGTVFRGVPYAAAPTGRRRFTASRPHPPWTGVRDATRPGPSAPQPTRDTFGALDMSPFFGPSWQRGEDYLTVDIWAPRRRPKPAPVMVYVHGGAFVSGSVNAPLYDGTAFARDGVLLVTVNYRLGVPGFLHLPDAPDNRGMLDVLAALRWIRDNAARFGGDPGTITLVGQSAGATLVGGVLAHPAAPGLIRRAVMQSGNGHGAFTTDQAGIVTAAVSTRLAVPATAAALAGVPDEQLIATVSSLGRLDLRTPDDHDPLGGLTPFSLVLDRQPADVVAETGTTVDLLIGSNHDEGNLYLAPLGRMSGTTVEDLHSTAARFHPRPHDLVEAYRRSRPAATIDDLRAAILGAGLFGAGTRAMTVAHAASGRAATFAYEFTWRPDSLGGRLGASHVMELPFVFDIAHRPSLHGPNALLGTTAAPSGLATRMHDAWVRFAATGNPGWQPTTSSAYRVQRIGDIWELVDDPAPLESAAWTSSTTR